MKNSLLLNDLNLDFVFFYFSLDNLDTNDETKRYYNYSTLIIILLESL